MWLQTVSALLIVLGMVIALRLALRGAGYLPAAGQRRSLRVTESCSLGQKQRLIVVEVDGERLLLGSGEGSVQLLRALGPAAPAAEAGAEEADARDEPGEGPARWWQTVRRVLRVAGIASLLVLALQAGPAEAQQLQASEDGSQLTLSLQGATAPERISSTLQILILMTVLSVAPSLLLVATSFTRIVIVLSLLRQAMGIHSLPPNQIIVGLALFVTFYVMAPVGTEIKTQALDPYIAEEIGEEELMTLAVEPVRAFMTRHTRETDVALFASLAGEEVPEDPAEIGFATLLPSFMISEIRTAFEIGFMVYLPFLIVDIVIASMLISMGMIVLPPIIISLPFKIMLFVLLDGWNLIITALVSGLL